MTLYRIHQRDEVIDGEGVELQIHTVYLVAWQDDCNLVLVVDRVEGLL